MKHKSMRTLELTLKAHQAIVDMPNLTWDQVVRRARGTQGKAFAPELGTRPPEGRRETREGREGSP